MFIFTSLLGKKKEFFIPSFILGNLQNFILNCKLGKNKETEKLSICVLTGKH
jgi:hypothetical protein